jgi:hypothetical protein
VDGKSLKVERHLLPNIQVLAQMPNTHLEYVVRCLRDAKSRISFDHPAYLDIECAAGSLASHLSEPQTIAVEKALDGVIKDLWTLFNSGFEGCEHPAPEVKTRQSTSSSK